MREDETERLVRPVDHSLSLPVRKHGVSSAPDKASTQASQVARNMEGQRGPSAQISLNTADVLVDLDLGTGQLSFNYPSAPLVTAFA